MDKASILQRAEEALQEIKPFLEADGGNISIIDVDDAGRLKVALEGACQTCNMSSMTVNGGLYETVKKFCPEVVGIDTVEVNVEGVIS